MYRRFFLSVLGAGISSAVAMSVHAKSGRVERLITLTGTGKGKARYRVDSPTKRKFMVEVENLKSLNGQALTVSLTSGGTTTSLGTIIVSALGTGKLELESQRGPGVPNVQVGDKVSVTTDTATLVLSGTF